MVIELFTLCDAATESGGKLNILGAFDVLWARDVPVIHQLCVVVVRFRFNREERGQHAMRITIVNADGVSMMPPLDGEMNVQFPDELSSGVANVIVQIQDMRFNQFGDYSVDIGLDGYHQKSLPLMVRRTPAFEGR